MKSHKDFLKLSRCSNPRRRSRMSFPRLRGNERTLNERNEMGLACWRSDIAAYDQKGDFARASWLLCKMPMYSKSLLAFASEREEQMQIPGNTFRVSMVVDENTRMILKPQDWKYRFVSQEFVPPTAVPPPGYLLQAEATRDSDICKGALIVMHEEFLKLLDICITHYMKHVLLLKMREFYPKTNANQVELQFRHIMKLSRFEDITEIKDKKGLRDSCTIDPNWVWPLTPCQAVATARALLYKAKVECFSELTPEGIQQYFDQFDMRVVRNKKVHYAQNLIVHPQDYRFREPRFKTMMTAEGLRAVSMLQVAEATGQLEQMGNIEVRKALMKTLHTQGVLK